LVRGRAPGPSGQRRLPCREVGGGWIHRITGTGSGAFRRKLCALEPGGMRTNWGVRANIESPTLFPEYEPSVGALTKALASYVGNEISDPTKVAQLILRLAASDQLPAHLLVGSDAVQFAGQAEATRAAEAERWREFSLSTDCNAAGALPALQF